MRSMILAVATGLALAGTTGVVAGAEPMKQAGQPAPSVKGMDKLEAASQRLREAIQNMADLKPGKQTNTAIQQAQQALFDAQSATVAIAPEVVEQGGRMSSRDEAMAKLKVAAQRLRESIQALAKAPAGKDRDFAVKQVQQAILEAQTAMVWLPNS